MTPEALIMESMFRVVDKNNVDRDFILNETQRSLDEALTGRDLVPKARQEGVSTYFLGRYTAACLSKDNIKAVIISHDSESTQRLLTRCQYFLSNLRGPKAEVGRDSMNIITFPKKNSMIYIGTAGSRKFGRGDTISHLHCSEYAYWPNKKIMLAGLLQAVPMSGEIAIESTGNGVGDDYHKRVMRAYQGLSVWTCHFFNWIDFPEYTVDLTVKEEKQVLDNLSEDYNEVDLVHKQGLTAGQIIWRRIKLEELDYDTGLFEQEYPITLDECFRASGNSLFYKVLYEPTKDWQKQETHLHVLDPHPMEKMIYVVGVDPSGGVGADNAAIEVICLNTMEQVGEYVYNRVDPYVLGERVVDLAKMFNNGYIVVEANNHGPVTIKAIEDKGYPDYLVYGMHTAGVDFEDKSLMRKGFRTSVRTKPIMIGRLRTLLSSELTIHSPTLNSELSTFVETEDGKMQAEEGCFDDRVMALACAAMGLERAGIFCTVEQYVRPRREVVDPFTLDAILEEMSNRRNSLPISPQTGGLTR